MALPGQGWAHGSAGITKLTTVSGKVACACGFFQAGCYPAQIGSKCRRMPTNGEDER
jgi:hypothetical protein